MNNGPSIPLTAPRIIAPMITSEGVLLDTLISPNFIEEAVQVSNFPCKIASRRAMKNTAVEHEMKVFQRSENLQ